MRYQVRFNDETTAVVEAREFYPQGAGIIFYKDRLLPREGRTDQWGNPVMSRQRVAVAFINNVQSILEIPEEAPEIPIAATEGINVATVPWGIAGQTLGTQIWVDEATPVDGDGINWDEAQVER